MHGTLLVYRTLLFRIMVNDNFSNNMWVLQPMAVGLELFGILLLMHLEIKVAYTLEAVNVCSKST